MTECLTRNAQRRVLLIDANPALRAAVAGFLRRCRIDVAGVASGEEGLRAQRNVGPSVCVIDLFLAGRMDGMEVAEALHARDPSLRFVFLSARLAPAWGGRPDFLSNALLLRKPVELEGLASVVMWLLTQVAEEKEACRMSPALRSNVRGRSPARLAGHVGRI